MGCYYCFVRVVVVVDFEDDQGGEEKGRGKIKFTPFKFRMRLDVEVCPSRQTYTLEQITVSRSLESKSKFYKPSTMVYGLSTTNSYICIEVKIG
ncbi:hypothetical protein GCM10011500_34410 [Mucilaginibacter rubeus]|nr:hypothetical protein GCM10011500_34410 [Mucilaginibacter rubeus]